MEYIFSMKLLEQRRQGALFFSYPCMLHGGNSPETGLGRYLPEAYEMNILACSHDEIRWLIDADNMVNAGKKLIDEFIQNPRQMNLTFELFDVNRLRCQEYAEAQAHIRPGMLSTQTLVKKVETYFELYQRLFDTAIFGELIDLYLSDNMKNELLKQNIPEKEIQQIISILAMPDEETFSHQAEKSVLRIAARIQKKGLPIEKAFTDAEIAEMVQNHLDEYYWITCNYFTYSGLGQHNLEMLINSALTQKETPEEKLHAFEKQSKTTQIEKETLKNKYSINHKTLFYFQLLQRVTMFYDNRKKAQMHGFYSMGRILKELAKRAEIDFDLAKYIFPHEITKLITKEISPQELYQRRKHTYIDYETLPPKILVGEEAASAEEKLWKMVTLSQNELNGACANPGTVIARARVIRSTKHLSQLQKGEILVTGMTSPEYVPALGKAVGIITDDGGITCHAGIIARELKLPCIVGTKTATRRIKTGDLLDLRAHHGTVRVLEKAAE